VSSHVCLLPPPTLTVCLPCTPPHLPLPHAAHHRGEPAAL